MLLTELNTSPAEELDSILLTCCDVPGWAAAVRAGRPFADVDAVLATADAAARRLSADEVDRA
ncbi:MAG: 2-oxo-4-hydroxy-4-carboxy-5-ureidoimidazoline decarboxylase, partial [Nocardioidaceae bacterium]